MTGDCETTRELGSPEYLEAVFGKARRDRVPLSGAFDLTYRCNFRCVHCYGGHLTAQPRLQAAELGTEQIKDLLREAAKAGCLFLLLSGGEPMLRDDFVEIYVAARRLGLIVTVFTNASVVTRAHLAAFSEFPPRVVEISVYGASEATYEKVTGVPGSFRRARRGIDQLLDSGVRVGLKTMILRDNVDEVYAIEALARDLGVRFRLDPLITPRLDGDPAPLAQRVDPQWAVAVELNTGERRMELARYLERQHATASSERVPTNRLYRCGAGIASFNVDPQGVVRPCLMSRALGYNAPILGFAAAWQGVMAAVDRATWQGAGGCAECPSIHVCGYCPGLFELERATPSEPPEYLCRLGESRYRAVRQQEPEVQCVGAS